MTTRFVHKAFLKVRTSTRITLMKQTTNNQEKTEKRISRRMFLSGASLTAVSLVSGCTPLKILFKTYPGEFDKKSDVRERTLRAFALTVVPGISERTPHLTRMLTDADYPFHEYAGFFASDLCSRTMDLYGHDRFDLLEYEYRVSVIQDGLNADGTTVELYRGAIYMTKIALYAGIYDADRGSLFIDFPGTNNGFTLEEMCYPNNGDFFPKPLTRNGIPS